MYMTRLCEDCLKKFNENGKITEWHECQIPIWVNEKENNKWTWKHGIMISSVIGFYIFTLII